MLGCSGERSHSEWGYLGGAARTAGVAGGGGNIPMPLPRLNPSPVETLICPRRTLRGRQRMVSDVPREEDEEDPNVDPLTAAERSGRQWPKIIAGVQSQLDHWA